MSFLEFYVLSLLVCVPLTILLCKYFNMQPKSNSLYMNKKDAMGLTMASFVPLLNVAIVIVLLGVFIFTNIESKLSKINLYKD